MDTAKMAACPNCFGDLSATPCPHCNWQPGADNPPPALALGTLLDGRYRIGRVLGHGGFGITYLARDENLQLRLAIKEYLPRDCATRAPAGVSLAIYSGQAGEQFAYGLDRFLDEARALARFDQHPGVVTVKSFFRAHGTGYCVMDYVEGLTLKQYLERQPGGRIPVEQAWRLLQPVMDALRAVHKEGLLHRDLAPDNIYITRDGRVKLLDFGAARFAAGEHSRSLSIILKPGYAPEEQYRSRGKQGPWTDVYGLAATLYRAVTGTVPPEALDRLDQDELALPSQLGIDIASDQERILLKALAVKAGDRYPTIAVWHDEWAHRAAKQPSEIPEPPIIPDSHEAAQPSGGRRIARSVLIVAILGGVGIVVIVGSMWWKEQIERPFLLPDADIEQPMAVEQAVETPAQTETESPPNEKPLETVSNADTGEVIEQPAAEPMLPSLSDPVTTQPLSRDAGLNCSNALSGVDRTICDTGALKALEDDLSIAFQEVKGLSTEEEIVMLERAQNRWVSQRETECSAESSNALISCIQLKTEDRLNLFLGKPGFGPGSASRIIPTFIVQDGQGSLYELDSQYLRFAGPDQQGEHALNAMTRTSIDEIDYIAEHHEGGAVWELSESQQLSYASERLISIRTRYWSYMGGMHDIWGTTSSHLDLGHGKILEFKDVFPRSAAGSLMGLCREQLITQKRERLNALNQEPTRDSHFDEKEIVKRITSLEYWSFLPTEAVITFGIYSFGSFVEGEYECRFGQTDLMALALPDALLPYSPAEEAVGAFRPSVEPSPDSSATVQANAESPQAVLGNTNTNIRASDSSATTVGISIYYAADTPPESNIPPEAPLCYRFQVSGLEEQLSKLKAKYQYLYGDEIMADGFGGKTLIAKRKDASGREVKYFYSTSPKACDDYQNRNRTTRIILSPVGEIGITINEHGAILEYDADRLYLGKDCDAYSARYGKGSWSWSNAGFGVEFQDKTYGFPRMDSPLDQPNCMLSYDSGRF